MNKFWRWAALGSALVFSQTTFAVIRVETRVDSATVDGVRTQAVITESSGFGGGELRAVAIKEIHSAIFIVDEAISRGGNALSVTKRQLTPSQAYGADLPGGYNEPPTTDPEGPWQGLVWPYRDQYDYFPNQFDPLADDVGTAFTIPPNVYGFVDVDAIARGGPTDPEPAGGDVDRLLRGLTGNGLTGPATYFAFDVQPLSGQLDRFITVRVISTTARVVVQDDFGAYSEILVQVPDFETVIQLPEPTAVAGAVIGAFALLRRNRSLRAR
jgi:hypothetical protein